MIFAEKLILLRKRSGWSQEELAEQMKVSRQSVSKWEGAQSIPDLEKMIRLSELFGVSLDYLLKENIEEVQTDEERISLRYDTAIGLFYAVGLFLGIGVFFIGGFMMMTGSGWLMSLLAGGCVFLVVGLIAHAFITLKREK